MQNYNKAILLLTVKSFCRLILQKTKLKITVSKYNEQSIDNASENVIHL
jgi:hypothetical protein